MRLLDGFRLTIESLDLVVLASRGHRAVLKQQFHQMNCFLHSIDADGRIIELNTGHLVLVRQPSSSRSPLDPTGRDDVQCCKFLRVDDRMTEVVACDQDTHTQLVRRLERSAKGCHRCELVSEMIGHDERGETEVLDPPAQGAPICSGRGAGSIDAEAERTSQLQRPRTPSSRYCCSRSQITTAYLSRTLAP